MFPSKFLKSSRIPALAAGLALVAAPAFAHVGVDSGAGFGTGFAHPFGGLDHMLAMVAVGLWAIQLAGKGNTRALWLLPLSFVLPMALGFLGGYLGLALPGVELGIAVSVLALGLVVAFSFRPPLWVAMLFTTAAALFHGHAHGAEMPETAAALSFGAGMVAATALLHVGGIALARLAQRAALPVLTRVAGAGVAAAGLVLLVG